MSRRRRSTKMLNSQSRLASRHDQQHLLRFWDELDDAGRQQLAPQIVAIDFDLIDSLFRDEVDQPDWAATGAAGVAAAGDTAR